MSHFDFNSRDISDDETELPEKASSNKRRISRPEYSDEEETYFNEKRNKEDEETIRTGDWTSVSKKPKTLSGYKKWYENGGREKRAEKYKNREKQWSDKIINKKKKWHKKINKSKDKAAKWKNHYYDLLENINEKDRIKNDKKNNKKNSYDSYGRKLRFI